MSYMTLEREIQELCEVHDAILVREGKAQHMDPTIYFVGEHHYNTKSLERAKVAAWFIPSCFFKAELHCKDSPLIILQTNTGPWRIVYEQMRTALEVFADKGEKGIEKMVEQDEIHLTKTPSDEHPIVLKRKESTGLHNMVKKKGYSF